MHMVPSAVLFQFGSQSISLDGSFYLVEFVICPCYLALGSLNNMETFFVRYVITILQSGWCALKLITPC
jgi:hypothetical protein